MRKHILTILCSFLGEWLAIAINKYFHIFIIFHRSFCRKQGRCMKCGRYICSGCNAMIDGQRGYCMKCRGDKDIILPRKPLIKPKNIQRYTKSCNDKYWDL